MAPRSMHQTGSQRRLGGTAQSFLSRYIVVSLAVRLYVINFVELQHLLIVTMSKSFTPTARSYCQVTLWLKFPIEVPEVRSSMSRQTRMTRLEVSQGHQTVAFHMLGIVSSCAIVTLSLRCAAFDIRLQKCRDLEIGVRGHSRSLSVAPFDRKLCMVSY